MTFSIFSKTIIVGCLTWPVWSSLICGFFGNYLGVVWAPLFATLSLLISFIIAIFSLYFILFLNKILIIEIFTCFKIPVVISLNNVFFYQADWALLFDSLTVIILVVITSISGLVHLYATSYIKTDPHVNRFFSFLSLFTFFILILVTAENYFQLFVGWEGVGLCSYLLITFWYTRLAANKSALQAVVINKFGDLALIIALLLLFFVYQNTSFSIIFQKDSLNLLIITIHIGYWSTSLGELIGFLLFIGAIAKSAQIGLHTWLLSAMEGPTPVSALLHAATIVTAGIFLIIRSNLLLIYAPTTLCLIVLFGSLTAFFAATCGLVQHDIKKIIAFSTCSQLGYIFYACGLSNFTASLYHLTNHAFFKALLFLCAGAVIHVLQGEQDLRRIGGLVKVMPITYISILIASLSLLGFPYISGFYSKDIVIELAWASYTVSGTFAFWLATFAAFLTAFYSTRLLYFVFLSNPNGYKNIYKNVHEVDEIILTSFRPLIFGSIFCGYFIKSIFINFGSSILAISLINCSGLSTLLEAEFLPFEIKLIPVIFSFLGLFLALFLYNTNSYLIIVNLQIQNNIWKNIHFFFIKKWYFDIIYNFYIANMVYVFGYFLYILGDQGLLEAVGPQGFYNTLKKVPKNLVFNGPSLYNLILGTISIFMFWFFNFL